MTTVVPIATRMRRSGTPTPGGSAGRQAEVAAFGMRLQAADALRSMLQ